MHGVERTSASAILCTARAHWGSKEKFRAPRGLGPSNSFFTRQKSKSYIIAWLWNISRTKKFSPLPPSPVVKFSTTSGFVLQGITACFFARHLYKFGKHCPKGTWWLFSCNISNPDLFISRADLFISGPDLVISGPELYLRPWDISGAQTYLSQDLVIFGSQAIYTSEKMV